MDVVGGFDVVVGGFGVDVGDVGVEVVCGWSILAVAWEMIIYPSWCDARRSGRVQCYDDGCLDGCSGSSCDSRSLCSRPTFEKAAAEQKRFRSMSHEGV